MPRWVCHYVGNKTFDFSSKNLDFFAQERPNLARNWHFCSSGPGLVSFFGALLVGWLVVVVRGLYLPRHLFTFIHKCIKALLRDLQSPNTRSMVHLKVAKPLDRFI